MISLKRQSIHVNKQTATVRVVGENTNHLLTFHHKTPVVLKIKSTIYTKSDKQSGIHIQADKTETALLGLEGLWAAAVSTRARTHTH